MAISISFMQLYANTERFPRLHILGNGDNVGRDLAGYRRQNGENPEDDHFYVIPVVFEKEICGGYEASKVCDVLSTIQWLRKNETPTEKRLKHRLKGKGYFYLFIGSLPIDDSTALH